MLWTVSVFALGVLTGWIVFKRPQFATDALAWIKLKIGMSS